MSLDDAGYFAQAGQIIVGEGEIRGIANTFLFSSTNSKTLLMLDYDHETTNSYLDRRAENISRALEPFIGRGVIGPDSMLKTIVNSAYGGSAMLSNTTVLDRVMVDAGSFLFGPPEARREEYSMIRTPLTEYEGYSSISSIDTILSLETYNREKKRKIVADAVSFIVALSAQLLYSTRGRVTYTPPSKCVQVANAKLDNRVYLVLLINDPLGDGWKVLGPEAGTANMNASELLEYSVKTVVEALFSMSFKTRKVNVTSSGVVTMAGEGALSVATPDIQHTALVEGRLTVGYAPASDTVAITVKPTEVGDPLSSVVVSPSVFSWFDMKSNGIIPGEKAAASFEGLYADEIHLERSPSTRSSHRIKKCKIADRDGWACRLVRLEAFTAKTPGEPDKTREKIKYLAQIVGDMSRASAGVTDGGGDYMSRADQLATVSYALTDLDGATLPLLDYGKGVASFTVVGNTPSGGGQSIRVIKLLKKLAIGLREVERSPECLTVACKWHNAAPNSIMTDGRRRGDNDNPMYVYTPRCLFHSKTAYVHLYCDSSCGPIAKLDFEGEALRVTAVDGDDIIIPLVVVAVASAAQKSISVIGPSEAVATPLKLFASLASPKNTVKFMTRESSNDSFREILNRDAIIESKWFEATSEEETVEPPSCLLRRLDEDEKPINLAVVNLETTDTEDSSETTTKYLSPFDRSLISYGLEVQKHHKRKQSALITLVL